MAVNTAIKNRIYRTEKEDEVYSQVIAKPSASHMEETGLSVRLQGFLNCFIMLPVL